jgi:hypothetical protein
MGSPLELASLGCHQLRCTLLEIVRRIPAEKPHLLIAQRRPGTPLVIPSRHR